MAQNIGGSVAVVYELLEDSRPLVAVVEELLEDNCPNPPPNIWTIVPTHRQQLTSKCGKINIQLKVNKQLTISKNLNFHSMHLCFEHF